MAQRATVLVPKTEPAPKRAGRAARAPAEAAKPRGIAVDLRKLVAPYKKSGRLTIRLERMPAQARFSSGRNNGDSSWSLSLDELEDLEFLPAPVFDAPVMLAIRIIAHDSIDAATLALLDYEISPEGATSAAPVMEAPSNVAEMEQLRRLREEMAELANRLAAREADLDAAGAEAEHVQAELARAREALQKERDARLASSAQTQETRVLSARQAEDARARTEQAGRELDAARRALVAREAELAQLRGQFQNAQAASDNAVRKAIATAETLWKAGEAARLAAAQAQWREQSEQALAEARVAARKNSKESRGESVRLHGELAVLRTQLAERDADAAGLRARLTEADAKAQALLDNTLNRAKELWKAEEAARLAGVEARLREQSERAIDEARAAAKKIGAGQSDAAREAAELRKQCDAQRSEAEDLRQYLAKRDAEIEKLRAALASAEPKAEQAVRQALLKAEEVWKAGEALRMTTAEARWREQSDRALAEASHAAKRSDGEARGELDRLNGEIAGLRKTLAERDADMAGLRARLAETAPKAEQAVREALARAEESWKAAEASRLAAAQSQWRAQLDATLGEARASAEKALGEERSERERQSAELSNLGNRVSERDGQIAQLQAALTQANLQRERDLQDALQTWKAGEAVRAAAAEAQWKTQLATIRAEHQGEQARIGAEAEAGRAKLSAQHAGELHGLRGEIANYRELLSARDGELARAGAAMAQAEKRATHDLDAARANAERDARERFQARLAEATARYETAESALVEMRIRTGNHTNEDSSRLLDEINALRSVVANREAELAQLRPLSEEHAPEPQQFSFIQNNRGAIVAALVAASVVMGGILLFPQIVPLLPYDWQVKIYEANGQMTNEDAPAAAPQTAPAQPAKAANAVVVRGVNLRAGPSTGSNVIVTLAAGTDVAQLETRGSWTRVRTADAKAPHEGWVFKTFLKAKSGA